MPGSLRRGVGRWNKPPPETVMPPMRRTPLQSRPHAPTNMSPQLRRNRMKKRLLLAGFALALGAGYTLTAFSQVKPEILVKQRQAAMTLQGKYFGPMAGMAQGKIPYNADVVARNAAYLDVLNKMPWDGFAESTKDVTVKTAALPAIWSEPAKFKEAQEKFQSAVSRLVAATTTGDEASIKAAILEVGKGGCGNCHQNFRQKD